ncbi:hypothetical protein [Paenibacillus harenae]|uniref:hypothetical protein n=1 Tax=Paenibacillus harenae TaxID=306543 RepID=UPI00279256F3|nr:hypothetical protein [Paenibacillus harenae]MDQ0057970.1 hypothetical protein [Paenibacillus harenae]
MRGWRLRTGRWPLATNGMITPDQNGKCQIKRTAVVRRLLFECAEINCEGKISTIPLSKLASGIKVGDVVEWSGRIWVLRQIKAGSEDQ